MMLEKLQRNPFADGKRIRADNAESNKNQQEENNRQIRKETINYLLNSPEMSSDLILAGNGDKKARERIIAKVEQSLNYRSLDVQRSGKIIDSIKKFLWGYHILEPLIEDERVSDIRVMGYNVIAANINGTYEHTDISFEDEEEYASFMQSLAVINKISLADINAKQVLTDNHSNPDWILRIAIATSYLTSNTFFMHIRKHPRVKRSYDTLIKMKMIPKELSGYFRSRWNKGLLVGGATGAGKTHFMNAMIDIVPDNICGMAMQESEELFASSEKSLISFLHIVQKKGEGKISYDLEDLSKFGLLTSNRLFIVGEIKGAEAAHFANAAYTGSIPWSTVHGTSTEDMIDKLVDYIVKATGYKVEFARKMLKSLETLVYMEDYKIVEVAEYVGFDEDKGKLLYKTVYKRKKEVAA